jgi:hypothetical protein
VLIVYFSKFKNLDLVDDGSSDGWSHLCDELASNTQISVIHKENSELHQQGMSVLNWLQEYLYGLWMATT